MNIKALFLHGFLPFGAGCSCCCNLARLRDRRGEGASEINAGGAGAAQRATAASISLAGREGQRPLASPSLRPAGRAKTASGMEARQGGDRPLGLGRAPFTTARPPAGRPKRLTGRHFPFDRHSLIEL